MENPFLRVKKNNDILRISIISAVIIIITIIFLLNDSLNEITGYKDFIINGKSRDAQRIEQLEKELKAKEAELKKYSILKNVIKNQIVQNGVDTKLAERYAVLIIKESNERGNSPLIQTALLQTESSFNANPLHDISGVVGMGGIYWDVWKDKLKQEKIAYNKNDLRNPSVNIKASAYILSCYMGDCKNIPVEALTRYKGYSKLGKSQANNVIKIAQNLKRKVEKDENIG